jgi:Glycosyl hydrolase catalytic core
MRSLIPAKACGAVVPFALAACLAFSGCGSGASMAPLASAGSTSNPSPPSSPNPPPSTPISKSAKRGIAYDLASPGDLAVLSPGVSWWYNWAPAPNASVPSDYASRYAMDFYPMLWNGTFNAGNFVAFLKVNPGIKYMLVLNEPNLVSQSNMTPQQAAQLWPQFEAIAAQTGVKIVGPAITWGTMTGYEDPVAWLDAFYAAYHAANSNRDPQIDYLAFHWYDYGLDAQLDRLTKYNKPFWVTEFANWHSQNDGAQVDTLANQEAQMTSMVATCEGRADVFRYAWFTGRWSPDPHFTSLLAGDGALTDLGKLYLTLPAQ